MSQADIKKSVWLSPITSLILYRVYNERNGRYSTFGITGLGCLASNPTKAFGADHTSSSRGSYKNLDPNNGPHQAVLSPIRDVETNNFK